MMLGALRSKNDKYSGEEIFQKLMMNKSIEGEDTQKLIQKYSESSSKLDKILECMKSNQKENYPQEIELLKESHRVEKLHLQKDHEKSMDELKEAHQREINKLNEKIKQLEGQKNSPEVCEIDLSTAMTGLNRHKK